MEISEFFPFWEKLTSQEQQLLEESTAVRTYEKGEIIHEKYFIRATAARPYPQGMYGQGRKLRLIVAGSHRDRTGHAVHEGTEGDGRARVVVRGPVDGA